MAKKNLITTDESYVKRINMKVAIETKSNLKESKR